MSERCEQFQDLKRISETAQVELLKKMKTSLENEEILAALEETSESEMNQSQEDRIADLLETSRELIMAGEMTKSEKILIEVHTDYPRNALANYLLAIVYAR